MSKRAELRALLEANEKRINGGAVGVAIPKMWDDLLDGFAAEVRAATWQNAYSTSLAHVRAQTATAESEK